MERTTFSNSNQEEEGSGLLYLWVNIYVHSTSSEIMNICRIRKLVKHLIGILYAQLLIICTVCRDSVPQKHQIHTVHLTHPEGRN